MRYFADLDRESLQRWTVCWMTQSGANLSPLRAQPVNRLTPIRWLTAAVDGVAGDDVTSK